MSRPDKWTCGHLSLAMCGECHRRLAWHAALLQSVADAAADVERLLGAAVFARLEAEPALKGLADPLAGLRDQLMILRAGLRLEAPRLEAEAALPAWTEAAPP